MPQIATPPKPLPHLSNKTAEIVIKYYLETFQQQTQNKVFLNLLREPNNESIYNRLYWLVLEEYPKIIIIYLYNNYK